MRSDYNQVIAEACQALGVFAEPYAVDRKRFAYSLRLFDERRFLWGKRVLDLGCGVGVMEVAFRMLGADVTGVDKFIFPSAVDNPYRINGFGKLRRVWEARGIVVKEADILERLPFGDGEFDLVNCDATIENLPYAPQHLFAEVKRVLRPQGVFLVTTPNFANLLRRIRFLFGRSPQWDIRDYFEEGEHFTGHRREFTVSELCAMVSLAGFTVLKWHTKNSFLNWRRIFHPHKWRAHWCAVFSLPFPFMREMLFVLAQKPPGSSPRGGASES